MQGQAQYMGSGQNDTKIVYYAGTDTLSTGYALCYDVAASVGATDKKLELGTKVIKPATENLMAFAGVVHPESSGCSTGWVKIIVPKRGVFCDVYTKADATAFTTALAPDDASYALAAHSDSTLNLPMVAVAAETADTSSTAATKKAMLLGG